MSRMTALLLLLAFAIAGTPAPAHAGLLGDFTFQLTLEPHDGSMMPAMTAIGPGDGEFINDNIRGLPRIAYGFPKDNGLQLSPTVGLDAAEPYSIVLEMRLDETTGYRRLVDFKNGQSDTGLYLLDGGLRFYNVSATAGHVCANTWVQVTITRDAAKNVNGYIDGNPAISFVDSGDLAAVSASTLRFFRDNDCVASCSEESGGAVARIIVFDSVIPQEQMRALSEIVCGDGNRDGVIKASDALYALKAAVGSLCCQVESCDVGAPSGISATDALAILKKAVGQAILLECP